MGFLLKELRLNQKSMIILWSEAALFSLVFGLAYRSLLTPIILFTILFFLLQSPKKVIYAIILLSFLWGMIFAALGYDAGGWGWAMALGGFVFYKGIRIHLRELKQDDMITDVFSVINPQQHWNFGRQNLN